ncbi:MAG TPA: serine O-acetyltransferase EpsC [Phycisphaeraceae bacterium]
MPSEPSPANNDQTAAWLSGLVDKVVQSYQDQPSLHHLNATFLPNRAKAIKLIELLRRVIFPGFFDEQRLTTQNVRFHAGELLLEIHDLLYEQVRQAIRYHVNRTEGNGRGDECEECDRKAQEIAAQFMDRIPELRRKLALDVQAAFEGDPAAVSTDETIFCYPGVDAVFIYRVAHELWQLKVPLLPRMMTEYAHNETGIDIHPGAQIGESFFIDHGTGVVIGETCVIGDRVKIYQGVTLGALSTKGGQAWRGRKRHPTIEDDVTIYGGAIILGGETVIGKGSVIGGSVFITSSVPAGHTVTMKKPELRVSQIRPRGRGKQAESQQAHDFQI